MGIEIERKFLVKNNSWQQNIQRSAEYKQAYLSNNNSCSVRIRTEGNLARLNIKSATLGITRQEFEYSIPMGDAEELFLLACTNHVSKQRHIIDYAGKTWELDVFSGDNSGLIVAEIELQQEDEQFEHPPWLGEEVSGDARYYNNMLAAHPYKDWK